jgi:hypothetical protein
MPCLDLVSFLIDLILTPVAVGGVPQHDHESGQPERMAKVEFQTSCRPATTELL